MRFACPGDVVVIVQEKEHPRFQREGNADLCCTFDITLEQALTGFPIDVVCVCVCVCACVRTVTVTVSAKR